MISNDDCWVICMLLSNVKSLFDHVTIKYTYSKVTTTQFIEHSTTERVAMPFKHKSGSRKRQEKKEQDEKAAKLPKLDSFLTRPSTSRQPTKSATDDPATDDPATDVPPASSIAAGQLGSVSLASDR